MTDVLLKPDDTGEIPRTEPGQTTTNLTWVTQPPAFRRPDATFKPAIIEGGCRTVVPEDAPEEFTTAPAEPPKLPPPPPPKVDDQQSAEIVWAQASVADSVFGAYNRWSTYVRPQVRPFAYAGRHRPGWHGKVRRFLYAVTAPLVSAL